MATILVVDDSNSLRSMVRASLVSQGHIVTEACDGQSAVEQLNDHQYDAIISDINMPNIDGIELVKIIRKHPQHQYTPILLLTTESTNTKKLEGKQAGATGWLVKPFNESSLIATINRLLA